MLYNRKIKTKLPSFDIHKETGEQAEIRRQHDEKKIRQKKYFDKRKKAAPKPIKVGDQILVKQDKTTTKPPFNPDPFKVTSVEGNRVTAVNGNKKVTRDKNQLKVLHPRPNAPVFELPELSEDDSSDEAESGSNIGFLLPRIRGNRM